MRNITIILVVVLLFVGVSQVSAQFYVVDSSTSIAGYNSWGSNYWKYCWYRYAQCWVEKAHSRALANPTYLNAIMDYSQQGQICTIDVFINTTEMLNLGDSLSYYSRGGGWQNWKTKSGGTQIGRYITPLGSIHGLASWNINSWISSHPSDEYYIVFDQLDRSGDAVVRQAWLGPQGKICDIFEDLQQTNNYNKMNMANSPNPFSNTTSIRYYITNIDNVSVKVYDIRGNCVRILSKMINQNPGGYSITWDGLDDNFKRAPNGTYFYIVETSNQVLQGKMILQH